MQNFASPQKGIAGLPPAMAQGTPAARPQMPQGAPQGAGPSMASLGSVGERVNAYRNNPQELQNKYAVSQDMLDLLALQQIKSEKEAAARQMALQMGGPSPGGEQPNIKQQREQEVMEMTKQQLAKQTGMVGQQQEQNKQAMLQRLMSGVARAPGAGNVMPAQMAGGGIVAFQDRGEVPAPRRTFGSAPDYEDARRFGINLSPYDSPAVRAQKLERLRVMREFEAQQKAQGRAEIPTEASEAARLTTERAFADPSRQMDMPGGAPTRMMDTRAIPMPEPQQQPPRAAPSGIQQVAPAATPNVPTTAEAAPLPVTPPPGGIANLPALGNRMAEIAMREAGRDKTAEELQQRNDYQSFMDPAIAEQRRTREANIAARRQAMESEFDPERQRQQALTEFLINARGPTFGGVMSSGARSSIAFERQQAAAQRAQREALEKMQEELATAGVTQRKSAFDVGAAGRAAAEKGIGEGLEAGSKLYQTQTQADVERERIKAQERMKGQELAMESRKLAEQAKANGLNALAMRFNQNAETLSRNQKRIDDELREAHKMIMALRMTKSDEELRKDKNNAALLDRYLSDKKAKEDQYIAPVLEERERLSSELTRAQGGTPATQSPARARPTQKYDITGKRI